MKNLIASFPNQLSEAVKIGKEADLAPNKTTIANIVITGLGGSGIGGSMIAEVLRNKLSVPVVVNKGYFLPEFVGENTLLIACSYSGNTEETLSAVAIGKEKNANIACITTGGNLLEIAKENGYNHIIVPGGSPPRSALGYSFTQLFFLLHHYGFIDNGFIEEIETSISALVELDNEITKDAKSLAAKLQGKIPVLYSSNEYEPILVRFRQQLNENAKMLSWHHVFPEMNHNELVGWKNDNDNLIAVFFSDNSIYQRTQKRMALTEPIIQKYCNTITIEPQGNSLLEKYFYCIYLCDWISLFLAEMQGVDPMEIEAIDYLKGELSKF